MTTMLTLSALVAALYVVAATWVRYRAAVSSAAVSQQPPAARLAALPDSLSALVYVLPQGRWRWLWSLWLAVVTLLVAPALTTALSATWWVSLFSAATVVCLAMTSALPLLPGYYNRLHNALGILAGILSQVCVWFICPWWLLMWLLMIAVSIDAWFAHEDATRWYDGKGVLLVELLCAATLYASLLTAV